MRSLGRMDIFFEKVENRGCGLGLKHFFEGFAGGAGQEDLAAIAVAQALEDVEHRAVVEIGVHLHTEDPVLARIILGGGKKCLHQALAVEAPFYRHAVHHEIIPGGEPLAVDAVIGGFVVKKQGTVDGDFPVFGQDKTVATLNILADDFGVWVAILPLVGAVLPAAFDGLGDDVPDGFGLREGGRL